MTHRKCRTWRCGFKIPNGNDHCPNCGMPKSLWRRVLTYLGLAPKYPNLRQAELEAWSTINSARILRFPSFVPLDGGSKPETGGNRVDDERRPIVAG